MWVSLQHKSNWYENTVTSIALSYATSKVASLYRKIMMAEVETHDKKYIWKKKWITANKAAQTMPR